MKTHRWAAYGLAVGAATAAAMWLGWPVEPEQAVVTVPAVQPQADTSNTTASAAPQHPPKGAAHPSQAPENLLNATLDTLLAQAMAATYSAAEGEAAREKLRGLARQDPAVARWLMQSYDKPYHSRSRGLIVALLFEIETPEALAFAKRLASGSDPAQQRDGFALLQNMPRDWPEVRPVILQALAGHGPSDTVLLALATLKPPMASNNAPPKAERPTHAAAMVTQLQGLTRHAAPEVRAESVLLLAQWDPSGASQALWATALTDPAPRVREAALVAIAQAGATSDAVKTALRDMAHNPQESSDLRDSALQLLKTPP